MKIRPFKLLFIFTILLFCTTEMSASFLFFGKKKPKNTTDTTKVVVEDKFMKFKKGAEVQNGFLDIIQKEKDFYYEIPSYFLNRDLLVINKIQKVPKELNEAGANKGINYENQLIRFEYDKKGKTILVRKVSPKPFVPEDNAIKQSVDENFISSIVTTLKIEEINKDTTAFIVKINEIYDGTDTSINNIFSNLNLGTSAVSKLSRIVATKAFINNVIVKSELTTKVTESTGSVYVSVEVSSSIVLLPQKPMAGRFEHNRVGYFAIPFTFFSDKQQEVESKSLITRWCLEPKEEDEEKYLSGELVEPKKPIVFHIDNSTPPQWREYMKKGIEDWQVAFEKAGFKNAIIAKEIDEKIDMDDVTYSSISYIASSKVNAMGPSVYDPRSGEIIAADIIWWHNVMTMLQKWLTVQTGAINPAVRTIQIPDSLMGDAIRFVACHEVGHSLGLRHNMKASAAYPTDSLRSKTFTDRINTTSASIMDYARFNYIAQPGDGVTSVSPHIGVYDLFAIEYGYRWYGKSNPHDEIPLLYNHLTKHKGIEYNYSEAQSSRDAVDPRALSEDLGDDLIKSSNYGIDNLKRVMPHIINWTSNGQPGQDYIEAGKLYSSIISQFDNYLYHVLSYIGGMYMEITEIGDGRKTYSFVEKEKQENAFQFLLKEIFTYPEWLFNTTINEYVYPARNSPFGYIQNSPTLLLNSLQSFMFWDLLENKRLIRMLENEIQNKKDAFTVVEMIDKLHKHVFKTTEAGTLPSLHERLLQKNMVDALILAVSTSATNKSTKSLVDKDIFGEGHDHLCPYHVYEAEVSLARAPNFYGTQSERISDAVSIKRGELLRIKELMQKRKNNADKATSYHYNDIILRINIALGF